MHNIAINHRAFHALDFKPQAVFAGYCGRYVSEMKILSISICLIILLCCNTNLIANQETDLPKAKSLEATSTNEISKFKKLKKGMSAAEVYSLVGLPTRHSGHGIAYDVYELHNSNQVWVAWLNGKTSWAFIKSPNKPKVVLFE